MSYKIKTKETNGQSQVVEIDKCPQECPICHSGLNLKFITAASNSKKHPWVQVVFRCMKSECNRLFIASYRKNGAGPFCLTGVEPTRPQLPSFPVSIHDISPMFIEMYHQAMFAEASDLKQLMGMGLSKSFEFLIKDFSIFRKPEEQDTIRAASFIQCIHKYIDDPGINKCTKLSSWLCSEEEFLTKRWEDKDIAAIKILIKMTVNWIENYLLMNDYTKGKIDLELIRSSD